MEPDRFMPIVGVVDQEAEWEGPLRRIVEAQGLALHFASSVAELRSEVPLDRILALILDLDTTGGQGRVLQRELLQNAIPPSVIVTCHDRLCVEAIESLELGAIALLLKPWDHDVMTRCLRYAEIQYFEQEVLHRKLATTREILASLTDRQRRVLELAATGMPNKLIALEIDVSQRTVEAERSKLLEAFGAKSVAEAMINLGEHRMLEKFEKLQRKAVGQRLGNFQPAAVAEASPSQIG
jgi:FixJ family two-component response regulator